MKNKIGADATVAKQFQAFLDSAGINIDVLTDVECDVAVAKCDTRKESDLKIIYSGGWIACETAHKLADKLGISARQMGLMLNHLHVKVRHCSLGCFE